MGDEKGAEDPKQQTAGRRRVGIIGYGSIGKYLAAEIQKRDDLELAFVWNRSKEALTGQIDDSLILENLENFKDRSADILVEVAHPSITAQFGEIFLKNADYMVGSPTAFADAALEARLRDAAAQNHGLYVPSGAFWGGEDIQKMADRGTLQALKVSMSKHPSSFKLNGDLKEKNEQVTDRTILYEGSVRGLCPLAPNNVNTMAAAAMAAHNLGFDGVTGVLVSDPSLSSCHVVEVEVWGPGNMATGSAFHVTTTRTNPAQVGAVTGSATYAAFLSSLLAAKGKGPGVHLC